MRWCVSSCSALTAIGSSTPRVSPWAADFDAAAATAIDVPEIDSRDAAVVRCASCGAAREEGAQGVRLLRIGLHDPRAGHGDDLPVVLCADQQRRPLLPPLRHGDRARGGRGRSDRPRSARPAATASFLNSRALGNTNLTVLECSVCAGPVAGRRGLPDARGACPQGRARDSRPGRASSRGDDRGRSHRRQDGDALYRPLPGVQDADDPHQLRARQRYPARPLP